MEGGVVYNSFIIKNDVDSNSFINIFVFYSFICLNKILSKHHA